MLEFSPLLDSPVTANPLGIQQKWANYGPLSNFLRPANNFSELARVVTGTSFFGFAFSLQR